MDVVNELEKTPCNHFFCQVCLSKWIIEEFKSKQEVTCPMCRKNLPFVITKYYERCQNERELCQREELYKILQELNKCCTLSEYTKQQEFLLKQCLGCDIEKIRQQYHIAIEKDGFFFNP